MYVLEPQTKSATGRPIVTSPLEWDFEYYAEAGALEHARPGYNGQIFM